MWLSTSFSSLLLSHHLLQVYAQAQSQGTGVPLTGWRSAPLSASAARAHTLPSHTHTGHPYPLHSGWVGMGVVLGWETLLHRRATWELCADCTTITQQRWNTAREADCRDADGTILSRLETKKIRLPDGKWDFSPFSCDFHCRRVN